MKKFLAVLCALMLAVVPVLSLAENAVSVTYNYHLDREGMTTLIGESEQLNQMLDLEENMTVKATVSETSLVESVTLNNGETVSYALELDGTTLYVDSSLLTAPLKVDLVDVVLAMLEGFGVDLNALASGDDAGLGLGDLMSVDLGELISDLMSCEISYTNTMIAGLGLMSALSVDENGTTVTLTADEMATVLDALAEDLKASTGVDAVFAKYLGVENATEQIVAVLDMIKTELLSQLSGPVVATYGDYGATLTVPLTDAEGNPDVYAVGYTGNAVSFVHNDEVVVIAYEVSENSAAVMVTYNGEEVLKISATAEAGVYILNIEAMGMTASAVVTTADNGGAIAVMLNNEIIFSASIEVNANNFIAVATCVDQTVVLQGVMDESGVKFTLDVNDENMMTITIAGTEIGAVVTVSVPGVEMVIDIVMTADQQADISASINGAHYMDCTVTMEMIEDYAGAGIDKDAAVDVLTLDFDQLMQMIQLPAFLTGEAA